MDDENKLPASMPAKNLAPKADDENATQMHDVPIASSSHNQNNELNPLNAKSEEVICAGELSKVSDALKSVEIVGGVSDNKGSLSLFILLQCLHEFFLGSFMTNIYVGVPLFYRIIKTFATWYNLGFLIALLAM